MIVRCCSLVPGRGTLLPPTALSAHSQVFARKEENMAERVGFEPTLPFRVNTLSKRAPSATRPYLRYKFLCLQEICSKVCYWLARPAYPAWRLEFYCALRGIATRADR